MNSNKQLRLVDIVRQRCSHEKQLREGEFSYGLQYGPNKDEKPLTLQVRFKGRREFRFKQVTLGFLGLVENEKGVFHTDALTSPVMNFDEICINWARVSDLSKVPNCLCFRAYDIKPEGMNDQEPRRDKPTLRLSFASHGSPFSLPTNLDLEST